MSKKTALHAVTLQRDHTHDGTRHSAGAEIHVEAHDRDWLIANGVVADTKTTEGKKP